VVLVSSLMVFTSSTSSAITLASVSSSCWTDHHWVPIITHC
jgi:hypothetical protein